nr:hypothetical protein [Planctomycetota bacterium]
MRIRDLAIPATLLALAACGDDAERKPLAPVVIPPAPAGTRAPAPAQAPVYDHRIEPAGQPAAPAQTAPIKAYVHARPVSVKELRNAWGTKIDEQVARDDIAGDQNPAVNRGDFMESVVNALVGTPGLTLVNRQQLGEVRDEHDRANDGAFDPAQIAERGRLVGADYLIMATPMSNQDAATKTAHPVAVILNLSSVRTGEIAASARGIGSDLH